MTIHFFPQLFNSVFISLLFSNVCTKSCFLTSLFRDFHVSKKPPINSNFLVQNCLKNCFKKKEKSEKVKSQV